MDQLKHFINIVSSPTIMFTALSAMFFFFFPPNDWFEKWNKRLGLHYLWTKPGGLFLLVLFVLFFLFGMTDANFRLIVLKPDNIPIVGLLFLTFFLLWLSMSQALANDARLTESLKPNEADDAKEKVLVWPHLVYIELIALILCSVLLIVWAILLKAPLEGPANPADSPNPSKAPWYFLGLQEMLVYFDPWIAGVLFPTVIIIGLMAIPYIDKNPKGAGFYSFKPRRMAVSIFLFCWLALWIFLIMVGTFLRGPNWNFFGPFEFWDLHKLEALNNVNLSELIYMILLNRRPPDNILLRECFGFLIVGGYFLVLPAILAKTWLKKLYDELGTVSFSIFVMLFLLTLSLPIKMYLRWAFNIKYLISIPEFFFNI